MAPDFNAESAFKASGSVAGLCNWAESMAKYHNVAKVRGRGLRPAPCTARGRRASLQLTPGATQPTVWHAPGTLSWRYPCTHATCCDPAGSRVRCVVPSVSLRWWSPRSPSCATPRPSSSWPRARRTRRRSAWPRCRPSWTRCRRSSTPPWRTSRRWRTTRPPRSARWTAPTRSSARLPVRGWGRALAGGVPGRAGTADGRGAGAAAAGLCVLPGVT
jgi:hypothetical protein